jgi:hypothetical protein
MNHSAIPINISNFQPEQFAQAQAAGIDRRKGYPTIKCFYMTKQSPHLSGGKNDRKS